MKPFLIPNGSLLYLVFIDMYNFKRISSKKGTTINIIVIKPPPKCQYLNSYDMLRTTRESRASILPNATIWTPAKDRSLDLKVMLYEFISTGHCSNISAKY